MPKTYRLAVAGLVHDHVWNELPRWKETGRVQLVAAAETHAPLRDRLRREYGVEALFESVEEMFDQTQPEIVLVCTSNAGAVPVIEKAAACGIHAVVEKPMAATLSGADRMLQAVQKAGTRLMINWPFRWRPATVAAWNRVRDGIVGEIFQARIRMAHKGPREFGCSEYFCNWLFDASQNGGGALIDYCSYGAVAARHLFGRPQAVQAVAGRLTKRDLVVEDNALLTLIYPQRFVLAEASWSQIPAYHDAIYFGTEGTLWTEEGRLFVADESGGKRELPVPPLPAGEQTGPRYFLKCLDEDREPADVCAPLICRDAQEILSAGLKAAETGERISLPTLPAEHTGS